MSRKYKKLAVYLLILLIPSCFIFQRPSKFDSLKTSVVRVVSGPIGILLWPFREIKKILTYHQTYDRYQTVKKQNELLQGKLLKQDDLLRENRRLKDLLGLKNNAPFASLTAEVIGRDPTGWNSILLINKGRNAGVAIGMPVVTPVGIVGKVSEVGPTISKVILLSDPDFSLAAVDQRSRESGLITGTLQGICRMRYLPPEADIEVGDRIVTSRLSSAFPEGLLIGKVIKVEPSRSSPTMECLVQPAVSLSQLEQVMVIRDK